jgi:hypothetical protein
MRQSDLFTQGSLVKFTIGKWGARLKTRAIDYGIADTADVQKALSLGVVRLAPAEVFKELNSIEYKAKQDWERSTIRFALFEGTRFCPQAGLDALIDRLDGYAREYMAEAGRLADSYSEIRAEMLPVIEKALAEAAKTPEDAARAFSRIASEYPSAEEVRSKFSMSNYAFTLSTPDNPTTALLRKEAVNMSEVIDGMMKDLYEKVKTQLDRVLKQVSTGGKLQERTIEDVNAILLQLTELNFVGDETLTKQINALRGYLSRVDRTAVDVGFVKGLQQVGEELEKSMADATKEAEAKLTGLGRRKLAS